MPALAINFRDLAPVQSELAAAGAELAASETLPASVAELVREMATSLRDMGPADWNQSVDPYLRVEVDQVAIAALLALAEPDEDVRVSVVELALEAMRDILHDIAESAVAADERPAAEICAWLRTTTHGSSQQLAELLGVSRRTFERWLAAASEPQGSDRMRLVLAVRIVNQLRHAMTGQGALMWFQRPIAELGGRTPAELLGGAASTPRLIALAAQSRRSDAS